MLGKEYGTITSFPKNDEAVGAIGSGIGEEGIPAGGCIGKICGGEKDDRAVLFLGDSINENGVPVGRLRGSTGKFDAESSLQNSLVER